MSEQISAGLNLVLYGMGTVFVFLIVLVLATIAMSALVGLTTPDTPASSPEESEDPLLIAAISAAVKKFRQRRN